MALLRGPGIVDDLDWRSRHEYWLREIARNSSNGNGGGGGDLDDDMLLLLQQIAGDLTDVRVLLERSGDRQIIRADRELYECLDLEVSNLPQFSIPADPNRVKVRICNNSGDSSNGYPVRDPCYVVVSSDPGGVSLGSWDQIILPGETALLDAPALKFYVATIKHDPDSIIGVFTITQYFAD